MTARLFEVRPDPSSDGWFLDTPSFETGEEITGAEFRRGRLWGERPQLHSQMYAEGNPVTFCRGGRGTYFLESALMSALRDALPVGRIEVIPVEIQGVSASYEILNVMNVVECIDEKRSEFGKWTEQDGRPEMVGRYRGVPRLVIDESRTGRHDLFLIKNWEVVMICSEGIRDLLLRNGVTGISFIPVETS